MLEPRKIKYKKIHKPCVKQDKLDYKTLFPILGVYGLKSLESGRLSVMQLMSAKKILLKKLKKNGQIIVNVFPHYSVTKKPQEVRMGKGKGEHKEWVCLVKAGCILFEVRGKALTEASMKKVFKLVSERISLATRYEKGIL